ncbi:hypothetical protein V8E54_003946 [Elaphomyces granulatus]
MTVIKIDDPQYARTGKIGLLDIEDADFKTPDGGIPGAPGAMGVIWFAIRNPVQPMRDCLGNMEQSFQKPPGNNQAVRKGVVGSIHVGSIQLLPHGHAVYLSTSARTMFPQVWAGAPTQRLALVRLTLILVLIDVMYESTYGMPLSPKTLSCGTGAKCDCRSMTAGNCRDNGTPMMPSTSAKKHSPASPSTPNSLLEFLGYVI